MLAMRRAAAAAAAACWLAAFTRAEPVKMEKLGAYVMQAGETSFVNWRNRTLVVQAVTGNTRTATGDDIYPCCSCTTFGCVSNASAHVGYVDCSGCTSCSADYKKAYGSCAPEFFQVVDYQTLEVLVSPIPGTEGFGFAAAFVDSGRLWVYGTNGINGTANHAATQVSCFSSADPTNATGAWESSLVLTQPAGYDVYNTDVWAVGGADAAAPQRRFIMSIEVNQIAGKRTDSWAVVFAETSASTPDRGWKLIDPPNHHVSDSFMTACPAVRFFNGWYYVATTTEGMCPAAGWSNKSAGTQRSGHKQAK